MGEITITKTEFQHIRTMLYEISGIRLADHKDFLVLQRLKRRLIHFGFSTFSEYINYIGNPKNVNEQQHAVDLLTTNETYFFREHQHFEFIQDTLALGQSNSVGIRVWSAACSSGQEPYSIGMLLDHMSTVRSWSILASDLSLEVLAKAKKGSYPLQSADNIPEKLLKKYCLKGTGNKSGTFIFSDRIRDKITFSQINLISSLPDIGQFDMVVLRNVMIYFDKETKKQVIGNIYEKIKPGGYLLIGHSESLHGISDQLNMVKPAVYQKY